MSGFYPQCYSALWSRGPARSLEKLKIYLHYHSAYGHIGTLSRSDRDLKSRQVIAPDKSNLLRKVAFLLKSGFQVIAFFIPLEVPCLEHGTIMVPCLEVGYLLIIVENFVYK